MPALLFDSSVIVNVYEIRYTFNPGDCHVLVSSQDVLTCQQNCTFLASASFEYSLQYICNEIEDHIANRYYEIDSELEFELI